MINNTNTNEGTTTTILGGDNMNIQLLNNLEVAISNAEKNGATLVGMAAAKRVLKALSQGTAGEEEYFLALGQLQMATNNAVIDSNQVLMKFSKLLKVKEYISFANITIACDKYGYACGSIGINSSPISRAFAHCKTEDSIIVPVGAAGHTEINKYSYAAFTKDIISVKFESTEDLKTAEDHGIYIIYAGRSTAAFYYNAVFNIWTNITSDEQSLTLEELKDFAIEIEGDLRLHKCFVFSPSDVRSISYTATDVTTIDNRDEILDTASNGAYTIAKALLEEYKLQESDPKKVEEFILKTIPRFGQLKAGSTNLGAIKSWVYYRGKFSTFCGNTIDGTAILKASFVAECFTNVLGITVTEEAVVGMFLQARPDMQKGAYLVYDDESFNILVNQLKIRAIENKCEIYNFGSEYSTMDPVLIVDTNIVKLESRHNLNDICLELLEIAAPSNANYSKSMHEKVLIVNPESAMELAYELGENHVVDKFEALLSVEESIPTPGVIKKAYASDVISCIAPQKIYETPALMRSMLKSVVQSTVNADDKLKFKIDGTNTRLTSDFTELFIGAGRENSLIKYGEIFMPHATKFFTRKYRTEAIEMAKELLLNKEDAIKFVNEYVTSKINDTKVCMIKYPSMGVKEYYLAKPLTLKAIFVRINHLKTTPEIKIALKRMYKNISEGVSILPANAVVMDQCAGLDYDYDGGTFVYDQKYCNILKPFTPEATIMSSN